MPRIFKGSESTLRLLISKTGDYQALTEIKIKLYTTDIENAIEIIDGIQVCKNIAIITLAPRAFMGMEDGLINYIIDGATEDDVFHTERQSNYMLKSLSYINEDGVATQTMTIESNGEYRVTPNDGLYVDINVNVPDLNGSYDEGYEQGKTDGINEQKGKLESINITENGTYTKEDGYNEIVVEVPDLNGSYDEGYGQGKTDGVNEQKSKLESINITENGTYTKEDGYNQIEVNVPDLNGSYDEGHRDGEQAGYNSGYTQGQADVAANARVLNVTENGVYRSKFSDPILPTVTGVYADGTEFHNYAELNGKVFNTKIVGSVDSRLEFWYKGDNTLASDFWNVIIGSGDIDNSDCFQVRYFIDLNNQLSIEVGNSNSLVDNWDDTVWHHLIVSKAEGLWIDGEKKGDFSPSNTINGEFFINGIGYNKDGSRSANGTFGMIKIDNTIIIPTADGFQNVNTGELLEVVQDGIYNFTESLPIYAEGELYKTINVNVPKEIASCNLGEGDFEFSIADLGTTYELYSSEEGGYDGWSKVTIRFIDGEPVYVYSAGGIFKDYNNGMIPGLGNYSYVCGKITEIQEVNTSADNNYATFVLDNCFKIDKCKWAYWDYNRKQQFESEDQIKIGATVVVYGIFQDNNGSLQFEEGTGMIVAYQECRPKINVKEAGIKLAYGTFTEVPEWVDFNGITDMSYMFYNCTNLQTIPLINTSNVTNMNNMFGYCNLKTIPLIDTSKVKNMLGMFFYCKNLQTIPQFDTSNVTTMENMFRECISLVSIPALNAQSLNMNQYTNIFGYTELPKLTDFGGFLNLKCSLTSDGNLKRLPNLTYESCINVLNGLYDFTGNGETPNSGQGRLKVAQSFIDKVGDEISIGINKGWQITV